MMTDSVTLKTEMMNVYRKRVSISFFTARSFI